MVSSKAMRKVENTSVAGSEGTSSDLQQVGWGEWGHQRQRA